MAVYTEVSDDELSDFLALYDIGQVVSFKGIAEGVENSNFLLRTRSSQFILTLYEKRVMATDLPFFVGLMEHLAERGVTCPQPVRTTLPLKSRTSNSGSCRPKSAATYPANQSRENLRTMTGLRAVAIVLDCRTLSSGVEFVPVALSGSPLRPESPVSLPFECRKVAILVH